MCCVLCGGVFERVVPTRGPHPRGFPICKACLDDAKAKEGLGFVGLLTKLLRP